MLELYEDAAVYGYPQVVIVEIMCRNNDLSFSEKIRAIPGVEDVTLIQYNGEYHG